MPSSSTEWTQPPRAVIFDLGDTLLDFGDIDVKAVFSKAARYTWEIWQQRHCDVPTFERYMKRQWSAWRWSHLVGWATGREPDVLKIQRKTCARMGLHADEAFFDTLMWHWYEKLAECATIEPETPRVLEQLHQSYRLGVISNSFIPPHAMDRHLQILGLLQWLPVRIYSCQAGCRKPNQRIFHLALDTLAVKPEQALYIGDKIKPDVRGARRVGIQPVLKISTRQADQRRQPPDHVPVIRHLHELPDLVDQWDND